MNQWPEGERGQADNRKPCKEMRLLFLVRGEDILPTVVVLPPTSLGAFKTFLLRLASRSLSYHQVVTRLGLEQAKNAKGISYSKAVPSLVERLDNETHAKIKAYGETLGVLFAQAGVQSSDA